MKKWIGLLIMGVCVGFVGIGLSTEDYHEQCSCYNATFKCCQYSNAPDHIYHWLDYSYGPIGRCDKKCTLKDTDVYHNGNRFDSLVDVCGPEKDIKCPAPNPPAKSK